MPLYDHSITYRQKKLRNVPHIMRLNQIIKLVAKIHKDSYCDIGCSNGFVTNKIVSKFGIVNAMGCDINRENIKIASERYPGIKFRYMNLNIVNPPDTKFKLVTCFETLEHVGNLENAIVNLMALTDADGTLLITVPEETGFIGLIKFLIKTVLFSQSLDELDCNKKFWVKYFFTLLTGKSVSRYRKICSGYVNHFGFDHRNVDTVLKNIGVDYCKFRKATTQFYLIHH